MKCLYLLLVLSVLLLISSCSFLTKETVLLNKKSVNWKRVESCQYCESFGWFMSYDYKYTKSTNENLSISVCPSLYGFSISFGPPLAPVIPSPGLFFPRHWEDHPFFVDLLFQNFNGRIVDLSSIDFIFYDKNMKLEADSILLLSQRIQRLKDEKGIQKITNKMYLIENDTTRIRFYFNAFRNKVRKLSIDFTKLKVNNSFISFTTIDFFKKSRFLYDPFVLGH